MARKKKRAHDPTEEDWAIALDTFKNLSYLPDDKYRDKIAQLARDLERAGLETHRSADRFEVLSLFTYKARQVRPSEHSRTAILTRVGYRDQTDRHLNLVRFILDRLVETGLRQYKALRQQAATLLDAVEFIDDHLRWYNDRIAELRRERKTTDGRKPSLMLQHILTMMIEWEVDHEEAAERLATADLHFEPETLRVELWRHKKRLASGNETPSPPHLLLLAETAS